MNAIQMAQVHCPYCGERIELTVDCSVESQECIEDCTVCCRPITVCVDVDAMGEASVTVRDENENF